MNLRIVINDGLGGGIKLTMEKQQQQIKEYWLNLDMFQANNYNESFLLYSVFDYLKVDSYLKNAKKTVIDYFGQNFQYKNTIYFILFLKLHLIENQLLFSYIPTSFRISYFFCSLAKINYSLGWLEREIWDMLGIVFLGHSNFRRILNDYGFSGFSLRNDFAVTGYVEQRYFDEVNSSYYNSVTFSQVFRNLKKNNPWYIK